ncbi:PulJ/GspJ family protein [Alicyclobacillus sendaiensis]|uniref:PulJ/GspJ family protein n=1 Tax=Alicyclobacillus sendaiensis TaxID=192387 RepID=UPI0026F42D62|nr:type II secretion system protein [Alicyclobacillus sendaiensis]
MSPFPWSQDLRRGRGLTLLETLVAIVITAIVGTALVGTIWQVALRSQRITQANQAVESVLTVNHALTQMTQSASYMQLQYGPGNISIWLFRGGTTVGNVVNASQPWLVNTTTISSGNVSSGIANATCFYVFDFVQQPNQLWSIYAGSATQPGVLPNFGGQPLAQNVSVQWYLPNLTGTSSNSTGSSTATWSQIFTQLFYGNSASQGVATASVPSGEVIHGFILKLSASYKAPNGQVSTYALTAGYHDMNQG